MAEGVKYVTWYQGDRNQSLTTPRTLFDALHRRFAFTMDGASSDSNKLLEKGSTVAAPLSWVGERVFCNPPWSDIPPFVELAVLAELAVLLVPARTNSRWFHRALALGARAEFFLGKPRFGEHKHTSPVDCLYLIYGAQTTALRSPSSGAILCSERPPSVLREGV